MTGIIILAAGQSSRLGKPKQNLLYKGKTLLQHTLIAAVNSVCEPVILVLGANSESIVPMVNTKIKIAYNPDWKEGMSSSIRMGVSELQKTIGIDSVIIMLCDQPFVDAQLISQILQQHLASRKGIIACAYSNTLGVPVLFTQKYFAELLTLKEHEGAKKLLSIHENDIEQVPFPKGCVDIDTIEDYDSLLK